MEALAAHPGYGGTSPHHQCAPGTRLLIIDDIRGDVRAAQGKSKAGQQQNKRSTGRGSPRKS